MLYQILPKKNYQFSSEKTLMLFKSLASPKKRDSFFKRIFSSGFDNQFIIDCDAKERVGFYFKTTNNDQSVLNVLKVWCGSEADVFEVRDTLKEYDVVDTLYKKEDSNNHDDKNTLAIYGNESIFMNVIGVMQKYTRVTIDFNMTQVSAGKSKGMRFSITSDVELEVLLRVYGHTQYSRNHVKDIAHQIANLLAGENYLYVDYKDSWKISRWSGMEIMNLFQLPTLFRKTDEALFSRIHYLRPGQITLNDYEFSSGVQVGQLDHPMQNDREIRVSETVLRTHSLITGTTGSGKTSAIEEQIKDYLLRKAKNEKDVPGFTFFDPAGSSVLGVLDMILKLEADGYDVKPLLDKVIYVDFSEQDYIFPISLINKGIASNELVSYLNSLFPDSIDAKQVNRTMNNAVNALMMDDEEYSIFDVERIFVDEDFRLRLANKLETRKDSMYATTEINFLRSKFNQNIVAPILNRLDPFANTRTKKLMFGMTTEYDSAKHIRTWMDEGYIILFNIKSLNEFDINTVVGYYALQYYRTALKRPDFSLLHELIVDESHKVQLPIFEKITAELRKQGLALTLMTQQMEQYNQEYLNKFLGNINTIISFRQNEEAAARRVRSFIFANIEIQDFKLLPDMRGYLSTTDAYDNKKKSVLISVDPPYRYTNGKLVNYLDKKAMNQNMEKNKEFAKQLMKRHMIVREKAEKIVFQKYFAKKEMQEYETQLLNTGDSLLSVEEGEKVSKKI